MKIESRLILSILLVCLIPLVVALVIVSSTTYNSIQDQYLNHLLSVAKVQKHRAVSIVDQNLQRLALLTSRTQLLLDLESYLDKPSRTLQEKINYNLQDALYSLITFENISVLNIDGEIIASTEEGLIGTNHEGNEFFNRGLIESSADILFLDAQDNLLVYVSGPLYREGKQIGVISARAISTDLIAMVQDYAGLGETGETLLARRNQQGDAVFITPLRFDSGAVLKRTVSKDALELPITQALLKNEQVFTDSIDYRGEKVFAATQYIPETDWGLVTKIDRSEAFMPIAALGRTLAVVIVTTSLLVITMGTLLARRISRPIVSLSNTAAEISNGNLSKRAAISSKDEIGNLANAFNQMAESLVQANTGLEQHLRERTNELEQEITERKQVEKTLRQSEERLRTYLESAPDGVYISDLKGKFLYGNERTEEITGYPKEELIGKSFLKLNLLPASNLPKATKLLALSALGRNTGPDQFELIRVDGSHIFVEITTTPIKQERETVVVGFVRDITERRRMDETLKESEERYRSLVDLGADFGEAVVMAQDTEKALAIQIFVNDEWSRITGYSKDELIGMPYFDLISLKDREQVLDRYRRRLKGEILSSIYELSITRKDGTEVPVEGIAGITVFKDNPALVVYLRDITEIKKAEEEIRKTRDYLENLNNSLAEVVFNVKFPERTIEYVNQAVETVYGYKPEECIGRNTEFLYPSRSEYLKAGKDIEYAFKHGKQAQTREYREVRKNGEIFPCEVTVSRMATDGKISSNIAVIRDISERKQAEEREKQLQEEINISSRLASVGEMAAGIAHEINNPLTGVIGYSGLLLQKGLPEDMRKDVNTIYEGAQRVASIIRRMLTFARQQKQEQNPTDINDVLEATLELRAYALDSNNIKVIKQLESDLPKTIADAGQLQQVFLNIILNAETEMINAHKGGNLFIKTEKVDSTIRISIKDDGPGILEENLDKVFNPFFTTREVGQGAGLGLSVSHGIITQHGGKIYIESEPGKGATFVIELPIVIKEEQLEMEVPTTEMPTAVSRARILVVDDEPIVQQYLTDILTDEGHEVEIIDKGDEAMDKLSNENYDVILLDIKLPDMSGTDIYRQLQKKDKSKARKVIFITGDAMGEDTMTFLFKAKAPYITKPFDIDKMMVEIGRKLSQK